MREELAAVQHKIWSQWMKYLFSQCNFNEDSTVTIPADKVLKWLRQTDIEYQALTEQEKESDRHRADKVLSTLVRAFWNMINVTP